MRPLHLSPVVGQLNQARVVRGPEDSSSTKVDRQLESAD